ncbi:putative RNA-directed DNA polymerase from transposon X-element [Trichonephila clavipes]|uniref:Putative RNA-directed DNA polymerase from transposon X-element n=1 Tax=Trichonephila clavipes TaxID=2585209 RepID=A0A8X6S867_TRICX|nr:putative RNA-directed DNA polymerase from transposon X-element [Trichonephila clavipes]
MKIAREEDSLYESTPVSKRSRRRKTSNTSDAMDTDADPSDTDYVTDDVKDIIRQYHPVCVALQETFLKSCHTTKIRRYGCVRKDTEGSSVSGCVCIFTSLYVPSSALSLHTSLQAVAVRIHSTSLITVCCLYLPPNAVIYQQDLNNLVDQLPAPFVIPGDFNGHSTLWGSVKTYPRSRQIEQLVVIPDATVKTESVDTAVQEVTNVLIVAADLSIPKVSSHSFQRYKPWWNTDCYTAYKNQRKLWGIFRRYPTTENLLAFKKAKANACRSGFRKGRSTLDNLVFLESEIRDAFVRRNHLVSLFFDIEKAYDRTWRYGILPVRYFHVRIGHSSSHKFIQDQGVPQGSVLSVTLFNIHMSSILHHLPPSVREMLYVDDLQVSCQGSAKRLIEGQLQTTVNRLVKGCDQNGHKISPSKSSCVHFCRKRNLHPDPLIHIGNVQIPVVSENYIHRVWQETWDQQILNKLHSIHPSTSHWAALPVRRHDVRLTRLRIGHTRFTHRHLLLGENTPECPSCKVPYSVYHILID